ncbi:hypothetical protein PUN4_550206 [Paraburkholderia unamae]|nr:hypothetical protein C7401_119120 [Paraburkholderia unamae]CAG9268202.1 hypothetical protein PUN4_550206 [Paraburkholderia unamae]
MLSDFFARLAIELAVALAGSNTFHVWVHRAFDSLVSIIT